MSEIDKIRIEYMYNISNDTRRNGYLGQTAVTARWNIFTTSADTRRKQGEVFTNFSFERIEISF